MELKTTEIPEQINNVISFRENVFKAIARKDPGKACFTSSLKDVKRAVIINAAPRSGSSLLFSLLKKIPQFYSPSAESVPYYKLAGLGAETFGSDSIPESPQISNAQLSALDRDILGDLFLAGEDNDVFSDEQLRDQYFDDLILRFALQWPQVNFSYNLFNRLARESFEACKIRFQQFSKEGFYLELLTRLVRAYPEINPYYYDMPAALIAAEFPALKVPFGPPHLGPMIEEPPFVLLSPHKKACPRDLAGKTLLLKSSVDAYRMRFIQSLIPQADIKVIYLTRNPAASINGLYDGWLYRGFFSYNMKALLNKYRKQSQIGELCIAGYSDKYAWGKWWWNYDLPPGWQDYTARKLEEVCAFQWCAANKAISGYLKSSQKEHCLARYENMIGSLKSRRKEICGILDFLGRNNSAVKEIKLDNLPTVQATELPGIFRWKKRKDIILPILGSPEVSQISDQLGYTKDTLKEWF